MLAEKIVVILLGLFWFGFAEANCESRLLFKDAEERIYLKCQVTIDGVTTFPKVTRKKCESYCSDHSPLVMSDALIQSLMLLKGPAQPNACQVSGKKRKAEDPKELELKKVRKKLVDTFHGKGEDEIHISFEKNEVPVIIYRDGEDILLRIESLDGDHDCLNLKISGSEKSGYSGYISQINADDACPFPQVQRGRGNYVLRLVDEIAAALRLKEIGLHDTTTLTCKDSNGQEIQDSEGDEVSVDLKFLSIMQKGKEWYHANGYFPEDGDKRLDLKEYERKIEVLRNFPLKDLRSNFEAINSPKDLKFFKKIYKKFVHESKGGVSRSPESKAPVLHEMMSGLFQQECEDYAYLSRLLLNEKELGIRELYSGHLYFKKTFNFE